MLKPSSGLPVFDTARSRWLSPVSPPFLGLTSSVRTTWKKRLVAWSNRHDGSVGSGPKMTVVRSMIGG